MRCAARSGSTSPTSSSRSKNPAAAARKLSCSTCGKPISFNWVRHGGRVERRPHDLTHRENALSDPAAGACRDAKAALLVGELGPRLGAELVGGSERSVDEQGVALAAVKGLGARSAAENRALRARLAKDDVEIASLRAELGRLASTVAKLLPAR